MARIHLCQYEGCEEEATAGQFGHTYCGEHWAQTRAEKEAEKEAQKAERQADKEASRARAPIRRGSLKGRIRDAVMMTAAIVAITDPRVYMAVEQTVDQFAEAWDNVAQQNPTARKFIEGLLVGGVWLTALGSTLVMVITTLLFTDRLPTNLHPLGHACLTIGGVTLPSPPVQPEQSGGSPPDGAQAS